MISLSIQTFFAGGGDVMTLQNCMSPSLVSVIRPFVRWRNSRNLVTSNRGLSRKP